MSKKYSASALAAVGVACAVLAAALTICAVIISAGGIDGYRASLKYAAISSIIEDSYIGDYEREDTDNAAYSAMIDALDDRWSYYMSAEEYDDYRQYSSNTYKGIGVSVRRDDASGGIAVTAVNAGSPAEAAGVTAGDVIMAVDGRPASELEISEVKAIIGEAVGETVELDIRSESGVERTVYVDCGVLYSDPVSYEMLDGNIGYIKIDNFQAGSGENSVKAIDSLVEAGTSGLIFDLRGNPGGLVTELLELLDALLPDGDMFVSVSRSGQEKVYVSDAEHVELPMCVLVDAASYSAAEFMAAAMQEYGAAVIVGQQTTGKGRSQVTYELRDGSAVHISHSVYMTPGRIDLSVSGGVMPDIVSELDEQSAAYAHAGALKHDDDDQLSAALSALGEMMGKAA